MPAASDKKSKSTTRKPAARPAAKSKASAGSTEPAVVVIGNHPAASLAALLLKLAKVEVVLADIGTTPNAERLVTVNPAFFKLHKKLEPLRSELNLQPVTSAGFLGPEGAAARSQPKKGDGKAAKPDVLAFVTDMVELRQAMRALAQEAGVETVDGSLSIESADETGVAIKIGRRQIKPKLLAVGDPLPPDATGVVKVPPFERPNSPVQATASLTDNRLGKAADEQTMPMALDLGGRLAWGWLLRRGKELQACVQHAAGDDTHALLDQWVSLLVEHEILSEGTSADRRTLRTQAMPLAGALERDVVARRTLLFGPAGGFYSASGEDIYPACWSATFAAEVAAKASKATHPQDALNTYRGKWGSTLGDYLRGPQQNLRFLLPLVYKNPVMTDRLADAILLGRSLVK